MVEICPIADSFGGEMIRRPAAAERDDVFLPFLMMAQVVERGGVQDAYLEQPKGVLCVANHGHDQQHGIIYIYIYIYTNNTAHAPHT